MCYIETYDSELNKICRCHDCWDSLAHLYRLTWVPSASVYKQTQCIFSVTDRRYGRLVKLFQYAHYVVSNGVYWFGMEAVVCMPSDDSWWSPLWIMRTGTLTCLHSIESRDLCMSRLFVTYECFHEIWREKLFRARPLVVALNSW